MYIAECNLKYLKDLAPTDYPANCLTLTRTLPANTGRLPACCCTVVWLSWMQVISFLPIAEKTGSRNADRTQTRERRKSSLQKRRKRCWPDYSCTCLWPYFSLFVVVDWFFFITIFYTRRKIRSRRMYFKTTTDRVVTSPQAFHIKIFTSASGFRLGVSRTPVVAGCCCARHANQPASHISHVIRSFVNYCLSGLR